MDWGVIRTELIAALAPLLIGILSALLGIAMKRLNDWLKAKVKSEILHNAMVQVADAVTTTVADIEKELRVYMGDGRLSREEALELKNLARKRIMAQAPAALGTLARAGVQNLEEYVGGKIEQYLINLKR
jgi:hypothetical protein